MQIQRINEFEIDHHVHRNITALRNACFPEAQVERSYYKQLPHFRYLVYEAAQLVAHMGVDHRMIAVGGHPLAIFGVIDLCVAASRRGRGIARRLLESVATLARERQIDFLFLINEDHRVYEQNGFTAVSGYCVWLRIDEHKNFGIAVEYLADEMMVKQIGTTPWPDGPIDLLGYMF